MNEACPALAVDVICYNPLTQKVALIERKFPPLGYALPGGFVDIGESCEDAARREMREELNVELLTLGLVGVYSEPNRDPRRHVVSVTYFAMVSDIPTPGDDAKAVEMVDIQEIKDILVGTSPKRLCFDHAKILKDAFHHGFLIGALG